ncbi:MAG: aldolase/citrate lyase family protein [Bryobacteraceae bacterium]
MSEPSTNPTPAIVPRENPVRKSLQDGRPVIGVTISTTSIEIAVQAADMGFDFLWIEMEHSPITLETARNIILATRGSRTMPFIRVPVNELWTAKRVMDMGALGVIFPFINSAESAARAAAACKYPPTGLRGSGAGLATFRWPAPGGYYDFADQNIMVVTNIEEAAALENIDAIADTPGIDVLFIGTSDLSFSLGLRGRQNEPALQQAIDKIVRVAHRAGKAVGRPLVNTSQYQQFVDAGFRFFQAQTELNLLAAGAEAYLKPLNRWQPSVGPRPMY